MKNKKLKILIPVLVLGLTSCGQVAEISKGTVTSQDAPTTSGIQPDSEVVSEQDDRIKAIYGLYAAATDNPLSYEEWLNSIKGAAGTSILLGQSEPSAEVGNVGDVFIDVTTYTLYLKTYNGWAKQGSLMGPAGKDGKDGRDGVDGLPGSDGKDGKDGRDGRDGVDGLPGSDGKDGKDGKDGRDGVDGLPGSDGKDGKDGRDGVDGLPGSDGKDGKDGRDGVDGLPGSDGKDGKDGEDGKSAYEIAVEHGYEGTEEEWIKLIEGNHSAEVYHIVTFDTKGGSLVEPQTIVHGNKAKKPADPVRKGYKFIDWVDENKDHWVFNGYSITDDITLYAVWELDEEQPPLDLHTVQTFYKYGDAIKVIDSKDYEEGYILNLPFIENFVEDGVEYKFNHWSVYYSESEVTNELEAYSNIEITEAITLTAYFEEVHDVPPVAQCNVAMYTFLSTGEYDQGTYALYDLGSTLSLSALPDVETTDGKVYRHTGWEVIYGPDSQVTYEETTVRLTVTSDMFIIPTYEEVPTVQKYNVTMYSFDPTAEVVYSVSSTKEYEVGYELELTTLDDIVTEDRTYTHYGWSITVEGSSPQMIENTQAILYVTGNTEIKPIYTWEEPDVFELRFTRESSYVYLGRSFDLCLELKLNGEIIDAKPYLEDGSLTLNVPEGITVDYETMKYTGVAVGNYVLTATMAEYKLFASMNIEVKDVIAEPEAVLTTVAGLLESTSTEMAHKQGYVLDDVYVVSFKEGSADGSQYGNFYIADSLDEDASRFYIYGATANEQALSWSETKGAYSFTNPKDFLTNEATKEIKIKSKVSLFIDTLVYSGEIRGEGIVLNVDNSEVGEAVLTPEPEVIAADVATVLGATDGNYKQAYELTATVKAYATNKGVETGSASKYGNLLLTDDSTEEIMFAYGATATETALVWNEESAAYVWQNPQDFLTNELTKTIVPGDKVRIKVTRADFGSTKEVVCIILGKVAEEPTSTVKNFLFSNNRHWSNIGAYGLDAEGNTVETTVGYYDTNTYGEDRFKITINTENVVSLVIYGNDEQIIINNLDGITEMTGFYVTETETGLDYGTYYSPDKDNHYLTVINTWGYYYAKDLLLVDYLKSLDSEVLASSVTQAVEGQYGSSINIALNNTEDKSAYLIELGYTEYDFAEYNPDEVASLPQGLTVRAFYNLEKDTLVILMKGIRFYQSDEFTDQLMINIVHISETEQIEGKPICPHPSAEVGE